MHTLLTVIYMCLYITEVKGFGLQCLGKEDSLLVLSVMFRYDGWVVLVSPYTVHMLRTKKSMKGRQKVVRLDDESR
ncbi:hypothetical protein HQ35_04030 [Porphyromonas cangingivalis]|uniref:Uncharacterized protein n=1 Tax=Porphyromonas cangingivalis TaxID=36874 RepID=A0A0A2EVL7_PORCN|nr:hypothetical protein HQ35_04030 [Porphyromonas cangingivalis]